MSILVQCPSCGRRLSVEDGSAGRRAQCEACGTVFQIPAGAADPPSANTSSIQSPSPHAAQYAHHHPTMKSQTVTYLLSYFVGWLGIDRFYLGQFGLGILKLITCGGFGIWVLIDLILAGIGAMRDADGLPLERAQYGYPTRSQAVAFLLSFFLGWLGADRFYLGQFGLGLLKLLTCGGFGIWYTVDSILVGCGVVRDVDGNSLR